MGDVPEQPTGEQQEEKPKSKMPIIIAAIVILLGVVSIIAMTLLGGEQNPDVSIESTPKPVYYKFMFEKPFTCNLAPPDSEYIFTVNIALEIKGKGDSSETDALNEIGIEGGKDKQDPKSQMTLVRAIIHDKLSSKTRLDVQSPIGREQLKGEIKRLLNDLLEKAEIVSVIFVSNVVT